MGNDPLSDPDFYSHNDENTVGVVINQLTNSENIALKSDIADPLKLSMWHTISKRMKDQGLSLSSSLMDSIEDNLLMFMVSHKRKSRKEIIEALMANNKNDEESKMAKLMGRGRF